MIEKKFKVWNVEKKRRFEEQEVITHLCTNIAIEDLNSFFKFDDDRIIVEYTGLKDKNGKEIYEGDVIERQFKEGSDIGVVERGIYSDSEYVDNIKCWMCSGRPVSDNGGLYGIQKHKNIVIGNIHENLELLKFN